MSIIMPRCAGVRHLSKHRSLLLAALLGLGAAGVGELSLGLKAGPTLVAPAYAQTAQHPASFADVVDKVKPTVISVKVLMNAGGTPRGFSEDALPRGTPFEDFFRRRFGDDGQRFGRGDGDGFSQRQPRRFFGRPDGNDSAQPRRNVAGQGSGFFISADGYAVTNNHVVDHADRVEITTDDGRTYAARVIGADASVDLALIKVDGRNDFPYAHFADRAPRIGAWVLAVGNPFGLGGTVTAGIVSARGRNIGAGSYDDFIQIDAAVNRGNSGGPSFDLDGNVVGVNTAIFSPSGGNVGIAFAIPADTVKTTVAQLRGGRSVASARGWLGVQIQPVTAEIADSLGMRDARGALVADVQAGSPAQRAGVRAGDVIVAVNGEALNEARSLAQRIGAMAPGTSVRLGVIRNGREESVAVTLGEQRDRQASRN
jgi:serine protease Do